jgi:hypothetical protein
LPHLIKSRADVLFHDWQKFSTVQAQLRYSDGSVLIFAGEVVDRGLRAGVIVAFLIGAIRMATEVDPDPVFILRALNRRSDIPPADSLKLNFSTVCGPMVHPVAPNAS